MKVVFNSEEEFLAELEKDKEQVARNIVRITNEWRRSPDLPITHVLSTAGYVVEFRSMNGIMKEQLVFLEKYHGDVMGDGKDSVSRRVHEKAQGTIERLGKTLTAAGYDVRPGKYYEKDYIPLISVSNTA